MLYIIANSIILVNFIHLNQRKRVNFFRNKIFIITNDDVLHPMLDVANTDNFYNKDKKVATLNEEGRLILIDKDDISYIYG